MIRTLSLAAVVAAGLAVPAYAADTANTAPDAHAIATHQAFLTGRANAEQARKVLISQGYINVSQLNRDDNGHWVGTAVKDGKTVPVALVLPVRSPEAPATN